MAAPGSFFKSSSLLSRLPAKLDNTIEMVIIETFKFKNMKKVKKLLENLGLSVEPEGLAYITTVAVNEIRLAMPTAYPVTADLQCLLGLGKRFYEYNKLAVLVPDESGGYYLIGNVHIFKEAIQTGTATLPAVVVNLDPALIPAFRRALNREALPLREHYETLFKLIDFYGRMGQGFFVRQDDGSQEALYDFLAALLNEDVEKILSATGIHWRNRDDLKELLYEGEIGIHEAFDEATAEEDEEYRANDELEGDEE